MLRILAAFPVLPVVPALVVAAWILMLIYRRRLRWWLLAAAAGLSASCFPMGSLAGRIEGGGSSRRLIWWNGAAALWCCFGMLVVTALVEGIYLLISRAEDEPDPSQSVPAAQQPGADRADVDQSLDRDVAEERVQDSTGQERLRGRPIDR